MPRRYASITRVAGIPRLAALVLLVAAPAVPVFGQQVVVPSPTARPRPETTAAPVERVGPTQVRVGSIQVDTAKKELTVPGTVNDVTVLEFLASTKLGNKGYESALELDTNAVSFNIACILLGLDSANAVIPRQKFDPEPPKGDPVEIWIEWEDSGKPRRVRAEQIIYNRETKETLSDGPWVYTGSVFVKENNRYLADVDGTVIGFMHTPSPIVENPRPLPGKWGSAIINPDLNLKAGTPIKLTMRVLPRQK